MNIIQSLVIFFIMIFCFTNCNSGSRPNSNNKQDNLLTKVSVNDTLQLDSNHKIFVDFEKNKEILDIILLIPENEFSSWEWKTSDRKKWYDEIKTNNFYVDTDPNFFNQNYLQPNTANFQIVDGYWTINIYKATDGSYIVITDDVVGDGHTLHFYEVINNTIQTYKDEQSIFSDYKDLLFKNNHSSICIEKCEDINFQLWERHFSPTHAEIEDSPYLSKKEYGDCLQGNAISYIFNPDTKVFDVENIYWRPKKEADLNNEI